jgi:hypothetical protein
MNIGRGVRLSFKKWQRESRNYRRAYKELEREVLERGVDERQIDYIPRSIIHWEMRGIFLKSRGLLNGEGTNNPVNKVVNKYREKMKEYERKIQTLE